MIFTQERVGRVGLETMVSQKAGGKKHEAYGSGVIEYFILICLVDDLPRRSHK